VGPCSDGRLYHPVVAEAASEAWKSRTGFRDRLAAAREKRGKSSTGEPAGKPETPAGKPSEKPAGKTPRAASSITTPIEAHKTMPTGSIIEPAEKPEAASTGSITEPIEAHKTHAIGVRGREVERIEKKDSASPRSADAEASAEPAEEDQAKPASGADKGADQPPDKPPDKPPDQPPPDLKTQLWRDGLASFRLLTKQADGLARKSLGKLLDAAGGDHAALLDAIRQAEITQPDGPIAWIRAAIQVRMAPLFANGPGQ
jgi:hypothetical protein